MKILRFYIGLVALMGCAHPTNKIATQPQLEIFKFENMPMVGPTPVGQEIFLGGFSALNFIKKENSKIYFKTITDRGPNAEEFTFLGGVGRNARPFLLPSFAPLLVDFSLDLTTQKIVIDKMIPFKGADKKNISGLPPQNTKSDIKNKHQKYEIAIDSHGRVTKQKKSGVDSEGFCIFNNTYLLSEEYGPDLLQFNLNNELIKHWTPSKGLPAELSMRKMNRGLEGLACDKKYAYLLMQSPLKSYLEKDSNLVRLIQFNPKTGRTEKEYFYPIRADVADKLGDLTLIRDQKFLVIEQNGKLGSENGVRKIYQIDLAQADANGLLKKELVIDLNTIGFDFVDKIEGIAILDSNSLALISDNDFGVESQLDLGTGKVSTKKDSFSYLAIIRFKENIF